MSDPAENIPARNPAFTGRDTLLAALGHDHPGTLKSATAADDR